MNVVWHTEKMNHATYHAATDNTGTEIISVIVYNQMSDCPVVYIMGEEQEVKHGTAEEAIAWAKKRLVKQLLALAAELLD